MASSSAAATVTIDRGYFDTLVRRARFNPDEPDDGPDESISISKAELDELRAIARNYECLRRNLIAGGVDLDTINILCRDPKESAPPTATTNTGYIQSAVPTSKQYSTAPSVQLPQPSSFPFHGHGHGHGHPGDYTNFQQPRTQTARGHANGYQDWNDAVQSPDDLSFSMDTPAEQPTNYANSALDRQPPRPQYDRIANRTLLLSNLAEGVTHGDIVSVVRGGMLLDVFLRANDRSAAVSFLHAADAKTFYEHVRRNDLYIKNKRVDIRWSDRQFILPGHVANKVGIGATRNLMVRRCSAKHTEESIRDDLEHIHNLVVIKVEFVGSNCFISTNSVHNAMFARTCMMSRVKYKGSKIEWYVDECAQSLERLQPRTVPKENVPPKKVLNPMANRFQLLNLDDDGEGDDHDNTKSFQTPTSVDIAA